MLWACKPIPFYYTILLSMGTEIFPLLLTFARILVYIMIGLALLVIILASIQMIIHRKDPVRKEEMKGLILNALIGLTIVCIVYVLLLGIGPAFNILFNKAA